jgi:hypothetical protein
MGFGNGEQLYEMRDRAAIALRASLALQIAVTRGDIEVEAKYRELHDPRCSGRMSQRQCRPMSMKHA